MSLIHMVLRSGPADHLVASSGSMVPHHSDHSQAIPAIPIPSIPSIPEGISGPLSIDAESIGMLSWAAEVSVSIPRLNLRHADRGAAIVGLGRPLAVSISDAVSNMAIGMETLGAPVGGADSMAWVQGNTVAQGRLGRPLAIVESIGMETLGAPLGVADSVARVHSNTTAIPISHTIEWLGRPLAVCETVSSVSIGMETLGAALRVADSMAWVESHTVTSIAIERLSFPLAVCVPSSVSNQPKAIIQTLRAASLRVDPAIRVEGEGTQAHTIHSISWGGQGQGQDGG